MIPLALVFAFIAGSADESGHPNLELGFGMAAIVAAYASSRRKRPQPHIMRGRVSVTWPSQQGGTYEMYLSDASVTLPK